MNKDTFSGWANTTTTTMMIVAEYTTQAQGVQAQTLSVHAKAKKLGVTLIPTLTKVDLNTANPIDVALSVSDLFGFDPDAVLLTSARSRLGIREVRSGE